MICAACPREARGFGWSDLSVQRSKRTVFQACSMACLDTIAKRNGQLEDMTKREIEAMYDAGASGGAYLDGLGKTDMATFTEDEWMSLVDAICTGYVDGIRTRTGFSIREEALVPY